MAAGMRTIYNVGSWYYVSEVIGTMYPHDDVLCVSPSEMAAYWHAAWKPKSSQWAQLNQVPGVESLYPMTKQTGQAARFFFKLSTRSCHRLLRLWEFLHWPSLRTDADGMGEQIFSQWGEATSMNPKEKLCFARNLDPVSFGRYNDC